LEHRDKKAFDSLNFNIDLESQEFETLSHPYFSPKVWNTKKKTFGSSKLNANDWKVESFLVSPFHSSTLSFG